MNSETSTDHGEASGRRQGRSRAWSAYQPRTGAWSVLMATTTLVPRVGSPAPDSAPRARTSRRCRRSLDEQVERHSGALRCTHSEHGLRHRTSNAGHESVRRGCAAGGRPRSTVRDVPATPRGPLPPGVYWRRRLAVLSVALVVFLGIGKILGHTS